MFVTPIIDVAKNIRNRQLTQARKYSETVRDIGVVPEIKYPDRRRACEFDFRLYCENYFSSVFFLPWSADHLEVIQMVEEVVLRGGLFAVAMSRGSGKSSLAEASSLWALSYGHQSFTAILGNCDLSATLLLDSVKTTLEVSDSLYQDFPEITHAIRELEGVTLRARGQTHHGERTRIEYNKNYMTLPTVKPDWHADPKFTDFLRPDGYSKASGARLQVVGITGGIRGMRFTRSDGTVSRPTLFLADDVQTDGSARSASQVATRLRILTTAVVNLGGPGVKVAGLIPCTVIQPNDVADQILNRELFPAFNGIRKKMIISWPTREDLWEEYKEIRIADQKANAGVEKCNRYYLEHRAEMDEGFVVSWPSRYNYDEISGQQHAYNNFIDKGPVAFASEYQNDPVLEDLEEGEDLKHLDILKKTNNHARGVVPAGVDQLTAFVDVQKECLYYCVCGFEPDFTGAVLDYGSFPNQKRHYFTLNDLRPRLSDIYRGLKFEERLFKALEDLTKSLLTRDWMRDDGTFFRISRLLIDSNWGASTDVVYRFCRQSEFSALLTPSAGKFVGCSSKPIREWHKYPGERIGMNWRLRALSGKRSVRSVIFDTNWYKSFVANRLLTPFGGKGCLTLFGNSPEQHKMLADHIMAEYRVRVEAKGGDRVVDEWKSRPDKRENHFWDCLVGCHVAASLQGIKLEEVVYTQKKTTKISFSDVQKQHQQQHAPGSTAKRVSFAELQRKKQNR